MGALEQRKGCSKALLDDCGGCNGVHIDHLRAQPTVIKPTPDLPQPKGSERLVGQKCLDASREHRGNSYPERD